MKILIRDVDRVPDGQMPKPFPLEKLAEVVKIPELVLRAVVRRGTIVELSIETTVINSTRFFVIS